VDNKYGIIFSYEDDDNNMEYISYWGETMRWQQNNNKLNLDCIKPNYREFMILK
jgi:hypothetical protein